MQAAREHMVKRLMRHVLLYNVADLRGMWESALHSRATVIFSSFLPEVHVCVDAPFALHASVPDGRREKGWAPRGWKPQGVRLLWSGL